MHSFADRAFYDDWWNSTSWDEFSRKWNRPVHTFLLRHVYASTMSSYKLTRQSAMFVTFLLSAAAHELVMAIVTKKIRFYLFMMQVRCPLAVSRGRARLTGGVVSSSRRSRSSPSAASRRSSETSSWATSSSG